MAAQTRLTFLFTESPESFRLFSCLFRIPKLRVKLRESEANPWIFGGDFLGTLQLDESFFGPAHACQGAAKADTRFYVTRITFEDDAKHLDRRFVFSLSAEDVGQPCACLHGGWIQAQRLFEQTPRFVQPSEFSHSGPFPQNQS